MRQGRQIYNIRAKGAYGKAKGQISILIVFSLIPMLTLFAFAVNVGVLVNAKINLQNAADLAAYAGAATQARQMTNISFLNYQMRQAYKKFIFRYYVLGNLSLSCFPRGGQAPARCNQAPFNGPKMIWKNPGNQGFPGMPSVCITLSPDSNPCQLGDTVPVVRPPSCIPFVDPSCDALTQAATQIANIQLLSCNANSTINTEVLLHWLYSTDEKGDAAGQPALAGLIDDIGVVPETFLLHERAQTVSRLINEPPQEVTSASLRRMEGDADPPRFERSILAFKTAVNNLNVGTEGGPNSGGNFLGESITMKELIPTSGMFEIQRVSAHIDTALTFLDGGSTGPNGPTGCNLNLSLVKAEPIVGVNVSEKSYVYYAIKLQANAALMFNPFPFGSNPAPSIQLTAYAAAAPFGSRIGPRLDESDFRLPATVKMANSLGNGPPTDVTVQYPFIKIADDPTEGTWEDRAVLEAYRNVLTLDPQGKITTGSVGARALARGLRAAQMPDLYEIGKYNIPTDAEESTADPAKRLGFQPYFKAGRDFLTFWAPITPIGEADTLRDKIDTEFENVSNTSTGALGNNPIANAKTAFKNKMVGGIQGYLGQLRSHTTHVSANGFNVAAMPDPVGQAFFASSFGAPPVAGIPAKVTSPRKLATSYATDHSEDYLAGGRVGYSVKFIPFRHLIAGGPKLSNAGSNGETHIPSFRSAFGPDVSDIEQIAH